MLYKADSNAYWIPEMVREDLSKEFKEVKDVESFWNFTTNTIGDYVFFKELPENSHEAHTEELYEFLN